MPRKIVPNNLNDLIQEYLSGSSIKELSDREGISRAALTSRFQEAGIVLRTQSESEAMKWSRMTPEVRANQVRAAHDATRGREYPLSGLELRALRRVRQVGAGEAELSELLTELGVDVDRQRPVSKYNIDLACGDVAVEVHRQRYHPMGHARERQRVVDLLDRGIRTLWIWVRYPETTIHPECAQEVHALLDLARGEPAAFGNYRVINAHGRREPALPSKGQYRTLELETEYGLDISGSNKG